MRQPAMPAADSMIADGPRLEPGRGSLHRRPPVAEATVEQDGIEPTASCLQSTRSTD